MHAPCTWRLLALLVVLAAFSVGVDMVHAALLGLSIDLSLSTSEPGAREEP